MTVKKQKKYIPPLPLPAAGIAGLPKCKPISIRRLTDVRYTTPLPHPTIPNPWQHSFMEMDHEIFSAIILSLLLIQEGQLSVSGDSTCTG